MFSGGTRRNVNLGNRKTVNREDALRNAERQRQQREAARRNFLIADVVQRRWRALKLLEDARLERAASFQQDDPYELAYVLPIFPILSTDEQHRLLTSAAESQSTVYSRMLVERLSSIKFTEGDCQVQHLASQIICKQIANGGSNISGKTAGIVFRSKAFDADVYTYLIANNPKEALTAAWFDHKILEEVPNEALKPLYNITDLPEIYSTEVSFLLKKLVANPEMSGEAWPLITAIVTKFKHERHIAYLAAQMGDMLASKQVFENAFKYSPQLAAEYVSTLKQHAPDFKTHIISNATANLSPTEAWTAYKMYDSDNLLNMALDAYSYSMFTFKDHMVSSWGPELQEVAEFVRDASLNVLLNYYPWQRVRLSDLDAALLTLLRQLFMRDYRMHLFPRGFWLCEVPIQQILRLPGDHSFGKPLSVVYNDSSDFEDEAMAEREREQPDACTAVGDTRLVLRPNPAARLLIYAPFFVPFETRAAVFSRLVEFERQVNSPFDYAERDHIDINRESIVEDAHHAFLQVGSNKMKSGLFVRFLSEGEPEAGVDGGGLTRELLMSVCEKAINDTSQKQAKKDGFPYPLFVETEQNQLLPNPLYGEHPDQFTPAVAARYRFLGMIIGRCLFENLLVDVEFSPFLLSKCASPSQRGTIFDLALLDHDLYKNLFKLYELTGEHVAELGLDFTTMSSEQEVVHLHPTLWNTTVTEANKQDYIRLFANYKLSVTFGKQVNAFASGLTLVVNALYLKMFTPDELNKLVSGETKDLDVEDLQKHTEAMGFTHDSPTLKHLWNVLREFTPEQRSKFLMFVTSVARGPLLGFHSLRPRFGIRCVGFDDERLPTASTCFNLLKLPEYSSYEILKAKLLYAIEAEAGFELS